jgi:cyclopropane fatty-acyl-phospholipid synthase-like methyltransferase
VPGDQARARRKKRAAQAEESLPAGPALHIKNMVTVAESLWGAGYCSPCGPGLVDAMAQPLDLEPGQDILEIGAGLGGGANLLSQKHQVKITALEHNETLGEYLEFLQGEASPDHPVTFGTFNPEDTGLGSKAYHSILLKDMLFQVADKENFLKQIKQAARTHAHLAVCDFVLAEKDAPPESLGSWMAQEPTDAYPLPVGDVLWHLRASGFHPISQKDITGMYLDGIRKALPQIQAVLSNIASNNPTDKDLARALLDHATLWLTRAAALESGALRVYYFHAVTKELKRKAG